MTATELVVTWQGTERGWCDPDAEPGYNLERLAADPSPEPNLRYWLAVVSDRLPGASPDTVATMALHCLRAMLTDDGSDQDNGPMAQASADLSDADTLTRRQRLLQMRPGDVAAERAIHAWVKADQDAPDHAAPAPDAFEGQRHLIVRKRSRKGRTTATPTRRGVAQVIGSDATNAPCQGWLSTSLGRSVKRRWHAVYLPAIARSDSTSQAIARWMVEYRPNRITARRGAYGYNVIGVNADTARIFGGAIPRMLDTEIKSYGQVIEAGSGAVDTFGVTVRHDDIGGYASTRELRRAMTEDADSWSRPEKSRLDWSTVTSLDQWPTARLSETTDQSKCIAPYVDGVHVWIGHELCERGDLARTPVAETRTIDAVNTRGIADSIAPRLADLAPGQRLTITHGAYHGAITRANSGRFSGRMTDDEGNRVTLKSARKHGAVVDWLAAI